MLMQSKNSSNESTGPRLLDRLRDAIRRRHYSRRTEEAYIHWTKRFIFFGFGHSDVSTTMIYTHVLNRGGKGVVSPLDTH
jgi:hypothetical protein